MSNEAIGLGFMPVDTASTLEGVDIELKFRDQMLSTGITEEEAIAAFAEFDRSIDLFADIMRREKAVLGEMIAAGDFKKKEPPKEPSRNDNDDVKLKSIIDVLKSTPDVEQCILTLNNLKERTKFYPVIFSEYSEDYIEDLMKVENAVFDKLISLINIDSTVLKSILHVLGDIKDCLHSDRPADDYIAKWRESNPDVVNGEVAIREVYALELEKAESILRNLL